MKFNDIQRLGQVFGKARSQTALNVSSHGVGSCYVRQFMRISCFNLPESIQGV